MKSLLSRAARWVDSHLVPVLSLNMYRNSFEACESVDHITSNGDFCFLEKITAKYAIASSVYLMCKILKKLYFITDERGLLYEAAETWVDALNGGIFLLLPCSICVGGSKPNLADLAVFGALRFSRNLSSGRDVVGHTRIGEWYSRMEEVVGGLSRIKA
ncbi:PREDICTED: prostaglandin E synthase 2-like [Theobroma cacao]|uniref:Prostaglandin E synthase 2-like n=1 Tax=Theobroma cacao TaxID=3641 RepID=A0AB32W0Z2_THECC|nr:PREDICTED: prostaglandin E synthase 2-like [Theobroma cacao]